MRWWLLQTGRPRLRAIGACGLAVLLLPLMLARETATAASEAPAESEGDGYTPSTATLVEGRVEYAPPKGWTYSKASEKENAHAYVSASREGAIAIEVWPADGQLTAGMGGAMVRKIRESRRNAGTKVLMDAKQEKDKRFAIRIHEQYEREVKGKEGEEPEKRVADQLHLYRKVGPRVVMVTVSSLAKEADQVKAIHAAGEAVAASAKYVPPPKPAKPPKPVKRGKKE